MKEHGLGVRGPVLMTLALTPLQGPLSNSPPLSESQPSQLQGGMGG